MGRSRANCRGSPGARTRAIEARVREARIAPGRHGSRSRYGVPAMTMFLRSLSQLVAPRPATEPISALRVAHLRTVCRALDDAEGDLVEIRDRALLALHSAHVRDGEIGRLQWEDVHFAKRSARLTLRSPRPGRPNRVIRVRASDDPELCGVSALRRWHECAGTGVSLVFTGWTTTGRGHHKNGTHAQFAESASHG